MRYDFVDLRLFLDVVTEGSITAGAGRAHLSLPSASARVRSLEHQAGVQLLVRGRRGVRPTPAGVALARHARDVLAHAARLESSVAGYARSSGAPLRLLAGSSAMHRLVPRALASFLLGHPEVDVSISERPSAVTARLLADGDADLGVVLEDVAHDAGLDAEPIGDDSLVVVGRSGGVLTERHGLTYREVAEHPMVGLQDSAPLQASITAHVGESAPLARYRTRAVELGTVVELAEAGVGLAIVPWRVVDPGRDLDVRELLDPWSHRRLTLCRGAAGGRVPAVEALAEHLARVADDGPGPRASVQGEG